MAKNQQTIAKTRQNMDRSTSKPFKPTQLVHANLSQQKAFKPLFSPISQFPTQNCLIPQWKNEKIETPLQKVHYQPVQAKQTSGQSQLSRLSLCKMTRMLLKPRIPSKGSVAQNRAKQRHKVSGIFDFGTHQCALDWGRFIYLDPNDSRRATTFSAALETHLNTDTCLSRNWPIAWWRVTINTYKRPLGILLSGIWIEESCCLLFKNW